MNWLIALSYKVTFSHQNYQFLWQWNYTTVRWCKLTGLWFGERSVHAPVDREMWRQVLLYLQLRYVFWLEENASRVVGQNSQTLYLNKLTNSLGRATSLITSSGWTNTLIPWENNNVNSHVIWSCSSKPRQSCEPAGLATTLAMRCWYALAHLFLLTPFSY